MATVWRFPARKGRSRRHRGKCAWAMEDHAAAADRLPTVTGRGLPPVNTGCCRRGPLAHVRRNRIGMEASRSDLVREVLFYIYHQACTPPPLLRPPLTSDLPTYHQLFPVCNRNTSRYPIVSVSAAPNWFSSGWSTLLIKKIYLTIFSYRYTLPHPYNESKLRSALDFLSRDLLVVLLSSVLKPQTYFV